MIPSRWFESLGVDRIALFGLSYGTKQALAYALAYPDHVERLLLDSVVLADGPDPFGPSSLQAIPAALKSICHAGGCAAATRDVVADFVMLVNRLEARPLVADVPIYTTHWAPTTRRIRRDGHGLLALGQRSEHGIAVTLPAAVRAALVGRPGLLEHLAALVSQQDSSSVNDAVFYATTCNDGPFPWKPDTPVANRRSVPRDRGVRAPDGGPGSIRSLGRGCVCRPMPRLAGTCGR